MVDLADGKTELRQAVLLQQVLGELSLHGGQLTLGDANFIAAFGRLNDAARVFRVLREMQHAVGYAHHGANQEVRQGEVDKRGGDERDDNRQIEDIAPVAQKRFAQRCLGDDDLDEVLRVAVQWTGDAHCPVIGAHKECQGFADQAEPVTYLGQRTAMHGRAQVEMRVDGQPLGRRQDHGAASVAPPGDGLDLGGAQKLLAKALRNGAAGCGFRCQRHQMGGH